MAQDEFTLEQIEYLKQRLTDMARNHDLRPEDREFGTRLVQIIEENDLGIEFSKEVNEFKRGVGGKQSELDVARAEHQAICAQNEKDAQVLRRQIFEIEQRLRNEQSH